MFSLHFIPQLNVLQRQSVRIAIKDILEHQYNITNSKIRQEYADKYQQRNFMSELEDTLESKGLLSNKSMNEVTSNFLLFV